MHERDGEVAALNAAYERAPCGLLAAAAGGKILRVNRTLCGWLGFPAADLVDRLTFLDLLTVGGRMFMQTHLVPLLQVQRSVAEVQLGLRRSDGAVIPVLVNVCRISEAGREVDEFAVVIVNDRHKYERELVQARQRAEEALKAKEAAEVALMTADRRKDEFLATLAHELRNPFSAMRSAIALLKRPDPPPADRDWAVHMLSRQLDQASRLTDDLLDVSRIAEGRIDLQRAPTDICAVVRDVIESTRARHFVKGASHSLVEEIVAEPIYVHGEAVRLSQIVQNLLNNALRYTPVGGNVRVSVIRQDEEVAITVTDDGIGIEQDQLTTIFDMFAQAATGGGPSKGGLGIGLALVRALARLHDGVVSARSEGPGKGSSFEVRFPVMPAADDFPAQASVPESAAASVGRRVLIVDDNEDAATSLSLVLESEGHITRAAKNGHEALKAEQQFNPEVVVLDLGLPDVDGREVARLIRCRRGLSVALVALTGRVEDRSLHAGEDCFDAYFVKPVNIGELLAVIGKTARCRSG